MPNVAEQSSAIRSYYEGLAKGVFRAVTCKACGGYTFPPTGCCEHCASWDVTPVELSGDATLLLASHNISPACHPRFEKIAPYVYGHLRLKEGPIVQGIVLGVKPTPEDLKALFERGPVPVKAETLQMSDLPVIAFRLAG
ncbi:zinc ribbon domain-containing protein [Kaistia dalseonensis]|uniref:OB-fold protein n=1 Tax=Kaistia dalseonensis TaxID=410840 RepID=A0ABU0HA03_9HYPH|nr:zinc ribbon domain-containing protein [Kaistia dalseonensis]MCX5496207.1 zinc ribbon domain-containing protein [Kaistia dalseonensis]MDQ0438822.1 putative OB-fold protein [Kaistia dalseonensis]